MKINRGDVAIVTGASRGLGVYIATALAEKGMSLVLAARSESTLNSVREQVRARGVDVLTVPTDVADAAALHALVGTSMKHFGRIDVLVNNAGFTYTLPYDHCEIEDIQRTTAVNLTAPMVLARLVLPHMIAAGRGHIVNIASLAGLLPSAYEELYTASKHGLVGFTRSLRASAQDRRWPISASTICPGFMDDAGIYEDYKKAYGINAPSALGSLSAKVLGKEIIRAIEKDLPDVHITKGPIRFSAAMMAMAPRIYESISKRMDTAKIFRVIADAHVEERRASGSRA